MLMGALRFEQNNISIRIIRSMNQEKIFKHDYEDYAICTEIVLVMIVILPFEETVHKYFLFPVLKRLKSL